MSIRKLLGGSLFAVLMASTSHVVAAEGEMVYTNKMDTASTEMGFGTSRAESYHVAMYIGDARMQGATITKVRVPVRSTEGLSNLRVWLSTALNVDKSSGTVTNAPDILTQEAQLSDSIVEVTLSQPYTITANGVYVGYSFDVDQLNDESKHPVAMASEKHDNALWLLTSRTYKSWKNFSSYGCSTLQVVVTGAPRNAASIASPAEINAFVGSETTVELTITNYGSAGVSSIDYVVDTEGKGFDNADLQPYHVDFGRYALPAQFGSSITIKGMMPAVAVKGKREAAFMLTKVNGESNGDVAPTCTSTLNVYDSKPKHRAVLEEYTGLGCSFCPRGFVGLEVMNRLYPDDFIGLSYHTTYGGKTDSMEVMPSTSFPNAVTGYPSAYLDRTDKVDPYYGFGLAGFALDQAWLAYCNMLAPADISVAASLDGKANSVTATAELFFPLEASSTNYKVEFVLVADSLYGAKWRQSNGFSGETFPEEEFEKFTKGSAEVGGLYFNDVVVATTRLSGNDVTLPADIEGGRTYAASATFALDKVLNTSGEPVIQNTNNLRVVALLIDSSNGHILNGAKGKVAGDEAGIVGVSGATTSRSATIYDIAGRRIGAMKRGLNIVRTTDGRVVKVAKAR